MSDDREFRQRLEDARRFSERERAALAHQRLILDCLRDLVREIEGADSWLRHTEAFDRAVEILKI